MSRYDWDEFLERYVDNREEFFFEYKNYSFWLTFDDNNRPCVNLINNNEISSRSIDELFIISGIINRFENFNDIMVITDNIPIMRCTYSYIKQMLLDKCVRFMIDGDIKIYSYSDFGKFQIVLSLSFENYKKLLTEFTLDSKTLEQIWNDLQ